MENIKIQWHPGFVAAMDMELSRNREKLKLESEHNLNRKPLEIDLLVIKKEPYEEIHNEIGKLFRGHNIMEYKSPSDTININTLYKVTSYACLYKSYETVTETVKENDITISIVRETKPEKLFKYFKENNVEVTMPYKGIYYVNWIPLFPIQIIATRELEQDKHMWIKALTDKMEKEDMEKLIEKSSEISNEHEKELVESILEVTLKANSSVAEKLIGDVKMGEMILKIVQPLILEKEKKAKTEGIQEGIQEGIEKGIEKGKILGAIEILRSFNSNDDIKTSYGK